MNQTVEITNQQDRVVLVDALRGFALMGLFLVHSIELFELYWKNMEPSAVHDVIFFLFAGKAYAIFAMLFGVSFFIIMDKQEQKGINFRWRFLWRLIVLFLLGTLNSMIYSGEVLQVLAGYGLILVLVYGLPSRWLLVLGVISLLNLQLIYHHLLAVSGAEGANAQPLSWSIYPKCLEIWSTSTSMWQVMQFNVTTGSFAKWLFFFEGSRGFQLFGLFLIGLVLGRVGFFQHPAKFIRARKKAFVLAILLAILLFGLNKYISALPAETWPDKAMAKWYLSELVGGYFALAFMVILVLGFVVLYQRAAGREWLNILAPVGRMSLTTYVMQGLVGVPFFYHYGLDMWDNLSQAQCLAIGAAFFGAQIAFAHWWLKRFYYGPLEWVWRAATYTSLDVPFKR